MRRRQLAYDVLLKVRGVLLPCVVKETKLRYSRRGVWIAKYWTTLALK